MDLDRIIGVFKLDSSVFAEIEHDQTATNQAAIIVAIVAVLSAIGSGISSAIGGGGGVLGGVLFALIWTFIGWIIWSAVTYFVGTSLFQGDADMGEMMRVIGYAYAPQMLGIIPCIGSLIGGIWSLIASFVAVKEGLDFDTGKAIATVVIGWLLVFILNLVIGSILGLGALGFGALTGGLGG
jgi:hypothetical protein